MKYILLFVLGFYSCKTKEPAKDPAEVKVSIAEPEKKIAIKERLKSSIEKWKLEDDGFNVSGTVNFDYNVSLKVELYAKDLYAAQDSLNNKEIEKLFHQLIGLMRTTHKRIYPEARKMFAETARKDLWQEDIDVEISTNTNEITFTGYHFAANRRIKLTMDALDKAFNALRFKKVNFRVSKHSSTTYFKLNTEKDSFMKGWD